MRVEHANSEYLLISALHLITSDYDACLIVASLVASRISIQN